MSLAGKAVVLVALALPLAALAQAPQGRLSYTYAEGRLVLEDPENGDRFDGIRLGGSVQFNPALFATGALTMLSSDGIDIDTLDLGLGFRNALAPATDLVGIVGLVWADVDAGPFGDDDTGLSLAGGVRSRMQSQFEVGAYASYVELFGDGDVTLTGEGLIHLGPEFSLVGSLGLSDDVTTLTFGARWNFAAPRQAAGQRML